MQTSGADNGYFQPLLGRERDRHVISVLTAVSLGPRVFGKETNSGRRENLLCGVGFEALSG